jgi:hypothetical protein
MYGVGGYQVTPEYHHAVRLKASCAEYSSMYIMDSPDEPMIHDM